MDKSKIISNLLNEAFVAMKDLKEGNYKDASDKFWAVVRKIDALQVVANLEYEKTG